MVELPITEQEASYLINKEKFITDEIVWISKNGRGYILEFIVNIEVDIPNVKLQLVVSRNIKLNKHSFTIVFNGAARIKSLDIGKGHKNPPDRKNNVGKKHKHTWTNEWRDEWAYRPDDITDNAPFEQVFSEFLIECNIQFEGALPPLPVIQGELGIDVELHGDQGVY